MSFGPAKSLAMRHQQLQPPLPTRQTEWSDNVEKGTTIFPIFFFSLTAASSVTDRHVISRVTTISSSLNCFLPPVRSYATAHSLGVMGIDNEVANETVGRAISSEQRQIMMILRLAGQSRNSALICLISYNHGPHLSSLLSALLSLACFTGGWGQ